MQRQIDTAESACQMFIPRGQPRKLVAVPRLTPIAMLPHISSSVFPSEHHLTSLTLPARPLNLSTRNSPSRFNFSFKTCAAALHFPCFLICDLADHNEWGPKNKGHLDNNGMFDCIII